MVMPVCDSLLLKECPMSAARRLVATSFAVAALAALAVSAPLVVPTATAGNGTVAAIGPGCCK